MTTTAIAPLVPEDVRALLLSATKTLGHVEFLKKDGTLRSMHFRVIHEKHIKGTGNKPPRDDMTNVYDVQAKGIRAVTHARVRTITVNGKKYEAAAENGATNQKDS